MNDCIAIELIRSRHYLAIVRAINRSYVTTSNCQSDCNWHLTLMTNKVRTVRNIPSSNENSPKYSTITDTQIYFKLYTPKAG